MDYHVYKINIKLDPIKLNGLVNISLTFPKQAETSINRPF